MEVDGEYVCATKKSVGRSAAEVLAEAEGLLRTSTQPTLNRPTREVGGPFGSARVRVNAHTMVWGLSAAKN
jgi:hypothetical protein